jgi:periplasmic copper chaperone A
MALAAGLGFAQVACAPRKALVIEHTEFRPPLGSGDIGAAYFSIRSARADRIVAISSSAARAVQIHASVTEGDIVTMKRMETIELPAGKTVKFEPGGLHLMVISPSKEAFESGFPITIELQSGARETVPFRKFDGAGNHHN